MYPVNALHLTPSPGMSRQRNLYCDPGPDPMQAVVLLGGGLAAVLVTVLKVDGGFSGVMKVAVEDKKLGLGSPEWSWTERTVQPGVASASIQQA
eukprot:9482133-Pyramimonas_sp.AAC.1